MSKRIYLLMAGLAAGVALAAGLGWSTGFSTLGVSLSGISGTSSPSDSAEPASARSERSALEKEGSVEVPDSLSHLSAEKKQLVREHLRKGEEPNQLIYSESPYLLLHAFNPVDWHPWGKQAFEKARRENKPIFLSIGYSTCYWCHVMERKVFSVDSIGALVNQSVVPIKVDREAQPDVDRIYMNALRLVSRGSGGWPASLFLTPDLKPFFGATYIPPDQEAQGRGFQTVVRQISRVWENQRQTVLDQADKVTAALQKRVAAGGEPQPVGRSVVKQGYEAFESRYDPTHGGFGQAPKFPRPAVPMFLMDYYEWQSAEQALSMSTHTLREMARGGMYDHLGHGFHRYSTDGQWRVPHFEKMLYDQALLTQAYLQAYRITGDSLHARIVREVLGFVDRVMRSPKGGFYSALNAESPPDSASIGEVPEEGAYYTWTYDRIAELLSEEETAVFTFVYGVQREGNALRDPHAKFKGENILYRARSVGEVAEEVGISRSRARSLLRKAETKLLEARQQRPHPHKDDKIVTGWNGLMISAYA